MKCVLFLVSAHKKSLAGLKLAWVMAAVCYIGTAACLVTLMRYAVDCQCYVDVDIIDLDVDVNVDIDVDISNDALVDVDVDADNNYNNYN